MKKSEEAIRGSYKSILIKKTKKIKHIVCIGLIFLLSINSFAAIVSDNDGSTFVTNELSDNLIQINFV